MKKFIKKTSFLFVLCFSISLCNINISANAKTNLDESTLNLEINELLNERANLMKPNSLQPKSMNKFKGKEENSKELQQRGIIVQFREKLKNMGETYSDIDTNFKITNMDKSLNNIVIVDGVEETYLTIEGDNTKTGYAAKHQLIYELINNELILVEDRQLEPSGLMPLYEAEKFVYDITENKDENKDKEKDKANKEFDKKKSSNEFIYNSSLELDSIENVKIRDNDVPASTIRSRIIDEKNLNLRAGYSYSAMATYLEKYWYNSNTAYRYFDGADCTNFASQALYAGGWAMNSGLYTSINYWWYNSLNQTYSWTSVEHWSQFARNSGRVYNLSSVWSMGIGDILQVKPSGSTEKVHTMMVSYVSNGVPYFTYHSNPRYRRSLNQVLIDWDGSTYYAYRT